MSTTRRSLLQPLALGASAGVVAALLMAGYAMVAAWTAGTGFFTPLHHIASLWASDESMMTSMNAAMTGNDFRLVLGPALLGVVIHLATGAGYGAAFGLLVSRADLGVAALAGVGLLYGLAVFAVSAFVGLPVAAAIFGSGDAVADMAAMAGWGTFLGEHLLFGLALGLVLALERGRSTARDHVVAH